MKYYPSSVTEVRLTSLLNSAFPKDIESRLEKLQEELNEAKEAYTTYSKTGSNEDLEKLRHEVADVFGVAVHTGHILGVNSREMTEDVIDKVAGRVVNPNYRR